jgi:hypothetical protein
MRIKKINLFILLYISISCTLFATFPLNKNNIYQSYKLLLSESKSQSQEISYENYFNFHQESNLSLNAFNKLCIKKYENQFSSPSLHSSSSSSSTNNEIANEEIDEPNYKLVYQKISIDTIRVGDLLYEPNKAYGLGHIAIVESIR